MAGTVSGHQLLNFPSPVLRPQNVVNADQVRGNDNQIVTFYNAHDADATLHLSRTTTTGVTTSAAPIYPAVTGNTWAIVSGYNGSTKAFVDTVVYYPGGTITAVSASTLGTADARTYSLSAGALQVAMAAGTYTIQVCPVTF